MGSQHAPNCRVLFQGPGVTVIWTPDGWRAGQAALEKEEVTTKHSVSQMMRAGKDLNCQMALTLNTHKKKALNDLGG